MSEAKDPTEQPLMQWELLSPAEKIAVKLACESSFEAFMRIFFQLVQGQYFKKNWHHTYECGLAEDVYYEKITRAIVNVAPGSTKTEIWSIHWPAWCIIKCFCEKKPSRWLPLSYSDDLVNENAGRVKEIIESEPFQAMWPMMISKDTKSKSNWKFRDKNNKEHRMYGTSTGGQVTGRRGGFMETGFTGAVIVDDPLPPKSGEQKEVMHKNNLQLTRVVRSRLAHDKVPIIVVQQRIGVGDSTDYLMSDKAPDTYERFTVPAIIDKEYLNKLSPEMREACITDTKFTGRRTSYWPDKEPTETLLKMESADIFMFSAQYQQKPDEALSEGMIYKKEIDDLIATDRFCRIPIEKSLMVNTYWDLGLNDNMVIWLVQQFGKELRVIACYANRDEDMSHYINWLQDFADKHGIRYGRHLAPHDIAVRNLLTKQSRLEEAKRMGIRFKLVERCKNKRQSIDALKLIFPRLWIDSVRCDTDISGVTGDMAKKTGWKALKALRRKWDFDNEVFKDEVGPKWATDYTDALQQLGLYLLDKPSEDKPQRPQKPPSGGWLRG